MAQTPPGPALFTLRTAGPSQWAERIIREHMSLQAGTRLGPYEVLSLIGAGGMGEVYRARDTKLHRDVAVKVLPEGVARDPERLARFTREAQTLAALNHPNIAHIHGLEESGGVRALVMELVDGEDLAQRLAGWEIADFDRRRDRGGLESERARGVLSQWKQDEVGGGWHQASFRRR